MKPLEIFLKHPRLIMNLWAPFIGSGIRVLAISPDSLSVDVVLKRRFWNQGPNGSQFGGSLFAMTDPFYPLLLSLNLGTSYIIWDKAASIRYRRPGMTDVFCHFALTAERLKEIRDTVDRNGTHDATFSIDIIDKANNVVATAERTIYIATRHAHKARLEARRTRT